MDWKTLKDDKADKINENNGIFNSCHLKVEGHSHNFWNFLHKFVPDCNKRIKWLELNSKIFYNHEAI